MTDICKKEDYSHQLVQPLTDRIKKMKMDKYNSADRLIHTVSQYLARVNKSYLPPQDDDSHTSLGFDQLGSRVCGGWIKSGVKSFMLSLNLGSFRLEWLNSALRVLPGSIPVAGRKMSVIESELIKSISMINLDPSELVTEMHYQIPEYFNGSDCFPEPDPEGIRKWIFYRGVANETSSLLKNHLQSDLDIRIWPHHFDTGIYVPLHDNMMGIGFGLAMEDDIGGSPYLYITGYPAEGNLNYTGLPEPGSGTWKTGEGWKGAVLPLDRIDRMHKDNLKGGVKTFLLTALDWFLTAGIKE